MKQQFLLAGLVAFCMTTAAPAHAAPVDLGNWTPVGDVVVDSPTSARLTTAAAEPLESGALAGGAVEFVPLESGLGLIGRLPSDSFEGSGLRLSITTTGNMLLSFDWLLSTVDYFDDSNDRGFFAVDGVLLPTFGEITSASPVSGQFSTLLGAPGTYELAFGLYDVFDYYGVTTLTVSNFGLNAVPEPSSAALMLVALGGLGFAAHRRRRQDQPLPDASPMWAPAAA